MLRAQVRLWYSVMVIFLTEREHGRRNLAQSNVKPTLPDAVAGDITAAMPYQSNDKYH